MFLATFSFPSDFPTPLLLFLNISFQISYIQILFSGSLPREFKQIISFVKNLSNPTVCLAVRGSPSHLIPWSLSPSLTSSVLFTLPVLIAVSCPIMSSHCFCTGSRSNPPIKHRGHHCTPSTLISPVATIARSIKSQSASGF